MGVGKSVPKVPVSAVGVIGQCCGCWSMLWVLISAVGVGQRCGCWSALWVLVSAVGA